MTFGSFDGAAWVRGTGTASTVRLFSAFVRLVSGKRFRILRAGNSPAAVRESSIMGILNIVEEAAGAYAADKALEAVDPNAGILAKTAAAVAGFEGVSKVKDMMEDNASTAAPEDAAAPETDTATD